MRVIFGWFCYALALTLANIVLFSLPPIISLVKQDWQLTGIETGFLMSAVYGGATLASALVGGLSLRFGVLPVIVGSLAYMGIMAGLSFLLPNYVSVFFVMALAGIGYASLNPAINQGLLRMTPPRLRGTGMSMKQLGITMGGAVSALLLPPIALQFGWKYGLLTAGLLTVGGGIFLLTVSLLGSGLPGSDGQPAARRNHLGSVSKLLRHPSVISLSLSAFLLTLAQMSFFMYWALFLEEDHGLALLQATQLLALAQAAGIVGRIIWGSISDGFFAHHRHRALQAICLISAVVTLMLYLNPDAGKPIIMIIGVILGFNLSGWGAVYQTALVESVSPDLAGTATGVSLTLVYSALFAGPVMFGTIKDLLGSYNQAWGVLASGLILAFFVLQISARFNHHRSVVTGDSRAGF